MKTILVLAPHPELAEAMRAGLSPEQFRVVHRVSDEEAEPMLVHGLAQVCVLDLELSGVQGVWLIEKLRRRAPRCPIIVYAGERQADWEEEAYLNGVRHVLNKPFRARLLTRCSIPCLLRPAWDKLCHVRWTLHFCLHRSRRVRRPCRIMLAAEPTLSKA